MAISYEEWLEANRNNPRVWGHSNLQNTMTIPSNPTHRRTMWGNSLSDQDVNSLIQSSVNNRNDLSLKNPDPNGMYYSSSEVFDAANPIVSETHTKKDNDGNSITTTIKGTYNDAKDKVSETFDTLSQGRQNIEDDLIAKKANINNAIIDGATDTWDYITSGRQNLEDALISGRASANDAITGYLSDGYDAASDAVAGTFADSRVFGGWFDGDNYHGIADAYERSVDTAKSLGKKGAEAWDEFGPGSGYLSGAYDKLLYGNEIPADQAGSNDSIVAAQNKVSEAITLAENETGHSFEVPSMNDIHPVDAHPAVIAAKKELQNQLLAQEEFKEEDQVNASKVLTSIKSSRPWKNLERIAGELEQKGYKVGDDFTEFAAENPMLTLASMYFGGPAITTVAGTSIRLASYLASKAPWVLNKLKWVASPSGIVLTLAGGEQYLNNKEEVDAWIEENIPQAVHSPLETLANALTGDQPDSVLKEDIETFLTSSESDEQVSLDDGSSNNSLVLDGETSTAETSTAETSTAETPPAETPSVFEVASDLGTINVSEAEAQVAEDLTITTGVENLSPTTDEAAKVLAKTPELIERMNSLADYMDSTTDEEALAAARQAAIDIENDPSHSDLTSAAAMTFIASMLFGGNLTDSFNAAFTPVGNYYTRKRETAAKIAEEKRLEEAVIRKEERAAKLASEVYDKERADELEDQEKADNLAIKLYNAEQLAINTRFNIAESNKRIIAEAKVKGQTIEDILKARKAETTRLVSGREKYISDKINGTSDDFAEKLLLGGKKTVGEQLVTALADIQDVVGRAKDIYGEPVQFDLTMTNPRNREAIDGALNDYRNDVMAGIDGGRTLTTYVTDRIIKRELAGFEQVIKPEWFQVPVKDHISTYIPSKEQMEAWGRDASDYNYGKLKKRGKHGNTEKAFAESTKKSYDKISNYAYSKDTASGNAMGMDNATRFFVKDFQDMQSNKPQEFDRMVRMAVKEGLHPFTYFVISYPSKAKFGKRFESKEQ